MITSLWLNVLDIPLGRWKALSQKTLAATVSMIRRMGYFVNGVHERMLRHRSFEVRMYRSISGTCLSAATRLSVMPTVDS